MAGANDIRLCNFRHVYLEVPTCRIRSGITTYMNLNEIFGIFRREKKKVLEQNQTVERPRKDTHIGGQLFGEQSTNF